MIPGVILDQKKNSLLKSDDFENVWPLTLTFDCVRLDPILTWPWPFYFCNFGFSLMNILSQTRALYDVSFRSYDQKGVVVLLRNLGLDLGPILTKNKWWSNNFATNLLWKFQNDTFEIDGMGAFSKLINREQTNKQTNTQTHKQTEPRNRSTYLAKSKIFAK